MSLHINAEKGAFAKVVLMPGDPMRVKWIAENFLHDVKLVNEVRGAFGYTGLMEDGTPVSLMASGMGMPSIGIYAHELYDFYGVEVVIRIGTCGSYQKNIKLKDVIIGQGACTDSNWMGQYGLNGGTYSAIGDYELLENAVNASRELGINSHVGNVLSADIFYDHDPKTWERWANLGVLGVEMESYALYTTAAEFKRKALAIFTVSDSFVVEEKLTAEERQLGLRDMVNVALRTAMKYNECHSK